MGYFPFYIDIKDKKCVIAGGGRVALRKLEKLIPFEPDITVIAPEINSEIESLGVKLLRRKIQDSDFDGAFFAVSATDDEEVNRHVFELCSRRGILINTVDDMEKCGFIFPALVKRDNITISVSTSGKSPAYAAYLRGRMEDITGEDDEKIVEALWRYRPIIKKKISDLGKRKLIFERLADICVKNGGIPEDGFILDFIEEMNNRYED